MILFDRAYLVAISSDIERIEIENLRVQFDIKKDTSSDQNELDLSVYNMNSTLRSKFEAENLKVEVLAGYNNVAKLIFKGDVVHTLHKKEGPDIITKVKSKDGGVAMRETMWVESFSAGTTVQQIVNKLSLSFGIPIKNIPADLQGSFSNGFSTSGPLKSLLDKLGDSFKFEWSIQDDELQITKNNELVDNVEIILNNETGLIGIPEKQTISGDNLKGDVKVVPNGVQATSLLLPEARPGRKLSLSSNIISGNFRITEVGHKGDSRGPDWYTLIKADLL